MKFRFPFEKVLSYRKTLEDMAQRDFQEASAELHRQEAALIAMYEEISKARENAFKKQVEGGTAGPALSQVDEFMRGQDIRMERQQAKIQECQKVVEKLREILRQKVIDYKIIESLREQRKKEFDREREKLEQKALNDQNVMRFRSRQRDNDEAED